MRGPYTSLFLIAPALAGAQYVYTDFDPGGQDDVIWALDTAQGNLWHVGPPQKAFFADPFSPPNVLITDTMATYPTHAQSSVLVKAPVQDLLWSPVFFMSFYQAFDTDTLQDGGYVEVSWDHGATWTNAFDDWLMPLEVEFFDPGWQPLQADTLSNGQIGFSGRSGSAATGVDWCFTSFCWTNTGLVQTDTLYVRFSFHSDSIPEARDGWMIDNLTFEAYFAHPVSAHERASGYFELHPNPMPDRSFLFFDLEHPTANVHVAIHDQQGRLKAVLWNGPRAAGRVILPIWRDALDLVPGLYHVVAEHDGRRQHKALVVPGNGHWPVGGP